MYGFVWSAVGGLKTAHVSSGPRTSLEHCLQVTALAGSVTNVGHLFPPQLTFAMLWYKTPTYATHTLTHSLHYNLLLLHTHHEPFPLRSSPHTEKNAPTGKVASK